MSIKKSFDSISQKYDTQRRQIIPCYDDFYHLPLTFMNCKSDSPKVLDIGAGTGLFSSILLEKYPNAQITLIDLSEKMLEVAKERFKSYKNFHYVVSDYLTYDFHESFDMIVSALSIHHLKEEEKASLFQKCYYLLSDDGIFINADQVRSPSASIENLHSDLWRRAVENSGLDQDSITQAYERVCHDNPSTLADQLKWLGEAGFKDVDCIYKYYHFCVMYAKK